MDAVGEGLAAAMSTLTGGFNANTGYDAAGIVFGRQYVSAGTSLLKAITAGVNACRNNGYGLQTSAVNYSRAEAASDLSGRAQVLGSPPCPAPVAAPGSPSSSGASVPPPLLWSVVAQFVGSPWPDGNPAEMRAAAAAWRAIAVPLYQVSGDAAGAYNTIAAQRIDEGPLMTADIRDIGSNLAGVASSCQQLAATLEQYAGQVEKTQQAILQLCDQVGSIGGIVGAFFEFLHGHGEDELHKIADAIKTVLTYLGTDADAALVLLESAKSSVDSWVLGLEKSADRTFVEFFGDQVGGALATHFNAVADSAEGVFRWGAGMAEGAIALDPTRFASSLDAAGQTWEGVAKFAQLVTNPAAAIASDPQGSLDTVKGLVHADDWSKDRPMLGASQNLLDIASVVIPGVGEAGAAGDAASAVGRVARTGEEAAGAAGAIGNVGEFGRSTAALGGVTKDVAGLTEKLGAIADKPSAPLAGGHPVSLTDPVDAGPRTPVARQRDPESAPAVGRPDEPAGGNVDAGESDHPLAAAGHEPASESPPVGSAHTSPPSAVVAGDGAERVPAVATPAGSHAPVSAGISERAPALAGAPVEALEPVGGSASAGEGLTGFGKDLGGPGHDLRSADSGLGVHGDHPHSWADTDSMHRLPDSGTHQNGPGDIGTQVGHPGAAANRADPGAHGAAAEGVAEHMPHGHPEGTYDHDVLDSHPSGLSPEKRDEILAMERGERPDPSEYLSPQFIHHHLEQFSDGAARFMPQSNLERYGIGQVDGTTFVMPKHEADGLLELSKGDPGALERALGLPEGFLEYNKVVRIDIPQPEDFGLRMPSGNEAGANDMWIPGGHLPDGSSEAIVDGGAIPNDRYDVSDISGPDSEG